VVATTTMTLPTVSLSTNTGMDLLYRNISNNYDEIKSRTSSPKPQSSRASLISSTKSLVVYYERMENNNNLEDVDMESFNSPQLSYATPKKQANQVSMVANSSTNMMNQHIPIEYLTSSPSHVDDDDVINIQLPYNPNASTEPELWDESFYSISFHRSLEYLASNTKNIKNSLNFITKYISSKNIDPKRSNELQDLKSIGKAV